MQSPKQNFVQTILSSTGRTHGLEGYAAPVASRFHKVFQRLVFSGSAIALLFSFLVVGVVPANCQAQASVAPGTEAQTSATQPATTPPTDAQASAPSRQPVSFDQVITTMVQRERFFVAQIRHLHPLIETYIQDLKGSKDEPALAGDHYFVGKLEISEGAGETTFKKDVHTSFMSKLTSLFQVNFLPLGFAQMVLLDTDFQAQNYNFVFVRREFLGQVRCLVIDVQPKAKSANGKFMGRIWVEDRDFNIVRFNGTYIAHQHHHAYFHFDSWRLNIRPGVWLPAFIYSEESGTATEERHFHFKSQTRLWGYDVQRLRGAQEFTEIEVDPEEGVKDASSGQQDASPIESERRWEHQAEDNVLERLQNIGLLAPPGDVDKVLVTVINNLLVTNNLDIEPAVRARVLLTTPLESFTVGHTIVVSRGLLDVLPDEASLAMVLAHELAHIVLGHSLDTELAFSDRMFFPDVDAFERFEFRRSPSDEEAADVKAMELLEKSPYKGKLGNAGLFLKQLQQSAPLLKNLITPRLGNRLIAGQDTRMSALLNSAPQLEPAKTDQIAALPLGGRVSVDPWTDRIELVKTPPLSLVSAREKLPLEVTPFFPFLKYAKDNQSSTASTSSP